MQLIRSLIFDICMYTLLIIMGLLGLPFVLFSTSGTYWVMRSYARITVWMLRIICGLRVEVRGTVPTDAVLVASKHQSFLDILVHFIHLPRARYIMKKELRWAPIFGIYALRIGSTPVARGKKGVAVHEMMTDVAKKSHVPGQLVIYPQGRRTLPGQDLPYKVGAGVIYTRAGQTCVPAATNIGLFWGRRSRIRKPGLAVLEYLDPIPPGLALEDFMAQLKKSVETASDALNAEAGYKPHI